MIRRNRGGSVADTEFVTQQEAVVAHLFWVTGTIEVVSVAVAGRSVSGRMLPPDPDRRAAIFEPAPGQALPERALRKGKVVLVKYASLQDEYQFKTQLMEVTPAQWLIGHPARHSANRPSDDSPQQRGREPPLHDSVAQTRWDIEDLAGERLVPGGDRDRL